jgi:nucleoside 2-deoxyribosyltransferase
MNNKLYVASKTKHADNWCSLRDNGAWPIISTWIDEAGVGETKSFQELWLRIAEEVRQCTALVLYFCKDDQPLKGALVEVGMALALGKKVYAVIEDIQLDDSAVKLLGSWIRHPNVVMCKDMNHVRLEISL